MMLASFPIIVPIHSGGGPIPLSALQGMLLATNIFIIIGYLVAVIFWYKQSKQKDSESFKDYFIDSDMNHSGIFVLHISFLFINGIALLLWFGDYCESFFK